MSETISVNFNVQDGKREEFSKWLDKITTEVGPSCLLGYRSDDFVHRREALQRFANEMEIVLRQHDHKSTWRDKPVEALFRLLRLEVEEASVAMEFFSAAEARHEMIDIANFAMILFDRLGMLKQEQLVRGQM
jgi:hypothetical protein